MRFKYCWTFIFCFLFFSLRIYAQIEKQYIFFLHNKFLEEHALNEKHSRYGIAEYQQIINKLKDKNTIIISEKRKSNTDPKCYAQKVKIQIDSLIAKGISPNNISVVGTSQGGYIAQYISYFVKKTQLKFVIIGASFKNDEMNKDAKFKLYGKFFSITEKSDTNQLSLSKQNRFIESNIEYFKEIELDTGLNHGFLFKALDQWILPTKKWIDMEFKDKYYVEKAFFE